MIGWIRVIMVKVKSVPFGDVIKAMSLDGETTGMSIEEKKRVPGMEPLGHLNV